MTEPLYSEEENQIHPVSQGFDDDNLLQDSSISMMEDIEKDSKELEEMNETQTTETLEVGFTQEPMKDAVSFEKMNSTDTKACFNLLSAIKKHPSATPFLNPVSPVLVPDYYTVITQPTDLSTMTIQVSTGGYSKPSELIADLQLLFQNCFKYNDKGSSVYHDGKKLYEFVFRQISMTFPHLLEAFEGEALKRSSKSVSAHSFNPDATKQPIVDSDISELVQSLETIKNQLDILEGKKPKKFGVFEEKISRRIPVPEPIRKERIKRSRSTPIREGFKCEYCQCTETPMWRGGPSGPRTLCNKCGVKWRSGRILKDRPPPPSTRTFTKSSSSSAIKKPKKRTISLAQKLELANVISNPNIDEDVLVHVVETIRASVPGLQKNEEVEIDMDKLGQNTLIKLWDYLTDEGILNSKA